MHSISRLFVLKKEKVRPGDVKGEIITMKRANESRRKLKNKLKAISNQSSKYRINTPSRRKLTLIDRNIGKSNTETNENSMRFINQSSGIRKFQISKEDVNNKEVEFVNYTNNKKSLPVSRRKNDILKISGRNFDNPEKKESLKQFQIKNRNNSNNKTLQVKDSYGTDDEEISEPKNKGFNPIEEIDSDGEDSDFMNFEVQNQPKYKETGFMKNKKNIPLNVESKMTLDEEGQAKQESNYEINLNILNPNLSQKNKSMTSIDGKGKDNEEKTNMEDDGKQNLNKNINVPYINDFQIESGKFLNIDSLENSGYVNKNQNQKIEEKNDNVPKFNFKKKMYSDFSKKKKKAFKEKQDLKKFI